jgi:hypothetical protein
LGVGEHVEDEAGRQEREKWTRCYRLGMDEADCREDISSGLSLQSAAVSADHLTAGDRFRALLMLSHLGTTALYIESICLYFTDTLRSRLYC